MVYRVLVDANFYGQGFFIPEMTKKSAPYLLLIMQWKPKLRVNQVLSPEIWSILIVGLQLHPEEGTRKMVARLP